MKSNIINVFLAGISAIGMASCGENTWNDHFLDGFEGGVDYENAVSGTYALTADDYKAISDLMSAKATTDEEKAEAKAIATNCYFYKNGAYPASVALPPYLASVSFPYYLASNGSQVDIGYAEVSEMPAELTALAGAEQYKVTTEDYINAWGSEEEYIDAFAPMTSAANKLPNILKNALPDATEGTYAVVNYNESETNPIFTAISGGDSFVGGTYYLIADGNMGAGPIAENKTFGYLAKVQMTVEGENVTTDQVNAFTFEETTGGFYYIKDSYGRYLYQTGTYNSFNLSTTTPEEGGVWSVAVASNGLATITNTSVEKWIQYSSNHNSWGSYNYEAGSLPKLYKAAAPAAATKAGSAVAGTPVTVNMNAVYYYNGSKWAVADGVSVLNPADYEAMGANNNKLSDPEIYLPIYLKNKLIYAQAGDQEYVVYNSDKADLFVFDGASWTLNNNGFENVVGRFVKANNAWSFNKYIGKATFTYFNEAQLILDRSYLFVYGSICATPLDKSVSYGYLPVASVTISGQSIIMPSDANAFTFASSAEVDGVQYKAPEGKFLIVDTTGRYNYYDGSHASMQLKATPDIVDGAIGDAFLWTATHNEDGTWVFEAKYDESNIRWLVYSSSYNNFAIYSTITENDHNCSLYLMDE